MSNLFDIIQFKLPQLKDNVSLREGNRLRIKMRATHSGYLVYNTRVYPGIYVRESYKSFFSKNRGGTADFDKPVLLHHDHSADPVGRVVGGEFIQLKSGPEFDQDYVTPDTPRNGGRGSGYVLLEAEITDLNAIEKVLDGRYQSVSVGFVPEAYYCSICGANLLKEYCEHIPGQEYEDEETGQKLLCYRITGKLRYLEVSFVNIPSLPLAKVIQIGNQTVDSQYCTLSKCDRALQSLVLVDDEGEEDLIVRPAKGKSAPRSPKTRPEVVVTVGSSFDLALISGDSPQDKEDSTKYGASGWLAPTAMPAVDEPNVDSDKEGIMKPDNKDDVKKQDQDTKSPDLKVLNASLEALTSERDSLKAALEQKDAEIAKLNDQLREEREEVDRLRTELDSLRGEMSKVLATAYLNTRVMLRKPDVAGKDRKELDELLEKFAQRSIDSLRDALQDLSLELDVLLANADKRDDQPGVTIDPDNHVDDPTLGKWTTTMPDGVRTKSDVLDKAFGGE